MTAPPAADDKPPSYLRASWQAFRLVLEDYHWITKLIAVVLVLCCLLGAAVAYWGEGLLARSLAGLNGLGLERLLTSDSFRMLLTLVFALLIAISIKRRQQAGLLDGDEHYNIGRALAFGYFKNFLVGTLLLARSKGRKLHIFKPANVDDLRRFEREVWPQITGRLQTRAEEVNPDAGLRRPPLVRRVVVIGAAQVDGEEMWLDFPTTLFTIGDYYASWNRWLVQDGRVPTEAAQLLKLEQGQIEEFFRHLRLLMTSDIGLNAVQEFGLTQSELLALQQQHCVEISLPELRARLTQAGPATGA